MKRILGVAIVVLCALLSASPASAGGEYQTPSATVEVLDDGNVRVEGSNCPPGSDVSITIRTDADDAVVGEATVEADAEGDFEAIIDTGNASGPATVTIECGGMVQVLGVNLGGSAPAAPLPRTGQGSSVPLARLGIVLLTAGGLAVYAARKRSARSARALA